MPDDLGRRLFAWGTSVCPRAPARFLLQQVASLVGAADLEWTPKAPNIIGIPQFLRVLIDFSVGRAVVRTSADDSRICN